MYLSVIIPAYNEEKRIRKTIAANIAYIQKKGFEAEVLIVDNGSTDGTQRIVNEFSRETPFVKLVQAHGRGKGSAVRFGMIRAEGDIRLFMDADNATTLDHFDLMEPLFREGDEVIFGTRDSRDLKEAKQVIPQSWYRRLLGDIGNLLIQVTVLPGIWDTQAGFKACTRKAAETIFSRARIDGFGFDIEMLALARKFKFKLGKVPLKWENDPDSKVSLSSYIKVFLEMFQVRWNLWTGKYR
jgi:dolichyl-phosphate beta-glucosyltransferase